jgi:hypothetical protein
MTADPLGNIFSKVRAGLDAEPDVAASDVPAPPVDGRVAEPDADVVVVEVVDEVVVTTEVVDFVPVVEAVDLLELAPVEPEPTWPVFSVAESATLDDHALRRRRDASVSSALGILATVVKRHLQDEQNDLLDALRRQKGRATPDTVLPVADRQVAAWAEALRAPVDDVYAAGRVLGGGRTRSAPDDLVARLAEVLVSPLRERVTMALTESLRDEADRSDADRQRVVAGAVGARYREWRGQDLEPTLGDLLTWAYARGVSDAAPVGTTLRWVPAEVQQCPDADDNALEPTCKGAAFPTGQSCPPAHPGCRCLVVPVDG